MNEHIPLRIAVLGLGKVAKTRFLPATSHVPGVRITALGTRQPDRLNPRALGLTDDCSITSYHALLDAGRSVADALYVALPNDMHVEWVQRAAQTGLHVLCEKPLTDHREAADSCRAACSAAGVLLAEAFMYRHDPRYARVRELLEAGAIGAVRLVDATFGYRLEDLNNIRLSAARRGGALMDIGCYGLDAVRYLLQDDIVGIQAQCTQGIRSGVDELFVATVQLSSGAMGVVKASTHMARQQSYRICGTEGNIVVPDAFNPLPERPRQLILERDHKEPSTEFFPPFDPFVAEIQVFLNSIRAGYLLSPLEDGVETASLLQAAITSMGRRATADFIGGS